MLLKFGEMCVAAQNWWVDVFLDDLRVVAAKVEKSQFFSFLRENPWFWSVFEYCCTVHVLEGHFDHVSKVKKKLLIFLKPSGNDLHGFLSRLDTSKACRTLLFNTDTSHEHGLS